MLETSGKIDWDSAIQSDEPVDLAPDGLGKDSAAVHHDVSVGDLLTETACLKAQVAGLLAKVAELKIIDLARNAELSQKASEKDEYIVLIQAEMAASSARWNLLMKENDALKAGCRVLRERLAESLEADGANRSKPERNGHYVMRMKTWLIASVFLRKYTGSVDKTWYLRVYRDVCKAGFHPVYHYVKYGAQERRNPSPFFSTSFYLQENADVRSSKVNPLLHFIIHGRSEGRLPLPLSIGRSREA